MRTLIHLNGPPGVGKSTLAGVYAEAHPGALNLDIDVVASLIGGASEDFFAVVGQARRLALTMAGEHLRSGSDVVMPQLVMNPSEAQRFEAVARQTASNYLEIALVAQPDEQIRRLHQRSTAAYGTDPVDEAILADGRGGALRRSRQEFEVYRALRPAIAVLKTDDADVAETLADLHTLLACLAAERFPRTARR